MQGSTYLCVVTGRIEDTQDGCKGGHDRSTSDVLESDEWRLVSSCGLRHWHGWKRRLRLPLVNSILYYVTSSIYGNRYYSKHCDFVYPWEFTVSSDVSSRAPASPWQMQLSNLILVGGDASDIDLPHMDLPRRQWLNSTVNKGTPRATLQRSLSQSPPRLKASSFACYLSAYIISLLQENSSILLPDILGCDGWSKGTVREAE